MNYKEIYMEKYLAGSDLDCFQGSFKTSINTITITKHYSNLRLMWYRSNGVGMNVDLVGAMHTGKVSEMDNLVLFLYLFI